MIDFNPGFPLEELKEKVNEGYFDEEVFTYLLETLKEGSDDSKGLISGQVTPYEIFSLSILERDNGWKSHYISAEDHGTVDKEIIDLIKNRIDLLFSKAKLDLGINKETALEVPVQKQHLVIIGFDDDLLNKKLERINSLAKELKSEINSLPSSIKVTYQNS